MTQIKNRWSGQVIAEGDRSLRELAEKHRANLWGANLSGADLREADLWGANLSGADLREADLREANLSGANLREANLSGANLWGADLREANLWGADLREANLWGADLREANLSGADLREAEIEFPQFPSIRTLSSMPLRNVSDEITLELMRLDADAHPHPELFDKWAEGGECPYQNEERWWYMPEKRDIWKPGKPTMRLADLILRICKEEGWGIRGYLPMKEKA